MCAHPDRNEVASGRVLRLPIVREEQRRNGSEGNKTEKQKQIVQRPENALNTGVSACVSAFRTWAQLRKTEKEQSGCTGFGWEATSKLGADECRQSTCLKEANFSLGGVEDGGWGMGESAGSRPREEVRI